MARNSIKLLLAQPLGKYQRLPSIKLQAVEFGDDPPAPERAMGGCRRAFRWRWLVDAVIGLTVLSVLAAGEYGVIPSVKLGFYCDDPKISHKLSGETISTTTLIVLSILLPLIGLWLVEWSGTVLDGLAGRWRRALAGMRRSLAWFWEYLVGLVVLLMLIDVAKILVGEPRPHFLDTCRPDAAVNCTSGRYIADYECTNKEMSFWWVQDSSRSFPSGHTATSVYMALFMMSFLQRRVPRPGPCLLLPWLHCVCLVWAMLCSFSRITDHRHHWWDVLAGGVMGVFGAVFTVLVQCGSFSGAGAGTTPLDCGKENGHAGDAAHTRSVRRLLSSTSSYTSSLVPEERELRDVAAS
ncbi:phospholipid phosphatase 3-like isoform X2 [Bacillus rossius redtenbacheri]|uniref:phospholipid phosphatase 3-like isoform X2 n=1 Tax=Bacillus rossius redtenbacheri TaxID=93214 RepID=UPI002FDEA237